MTLELISTARLSLRCPDAKDGQSLYDNVFSDAAVMRFVFEGLPFTQQRAAEFFGSAFDHEKSGLKLGVLSERRTSAVIGFAGLMACATLGEHDYEIGFVLAHSACGKGYATEIGIAQLEYGFRTTGCNRLLAQVDPGNHPSVNVLRKIGMTFHSTVKTEGRGVRDIYFASSARR